MSLLTIPVTNRDHLQGTLGAPCGLVEYGDYECPSCAVVEPVIKQLQERFGDQLFFVFRNFPLREIHPYAEPAARLAELAGIYGKFWEAHDLLFANQDSLGNTLLLEVSRRLLLTDEAIQSAHSNATVSKRIQADFSGGIRSGVNGTPSFFLNSERYDGPTDFQSIADSIEQILASDGE